MTVDTIVYETKNSGARIALLGNGVMEELEISAENKAAEGNIYLGRICRKIDLANGKIGFFVDLGNGREAFLNAEEFGLNELNATEGQSVVVQVAQEKRAEKGPKVTRALQFVGENLVYCPYRMNVEVSQKISDKDKAAEYKQLVLDNMTGQEGWVVRTSAVNSSHEAVVAEMEQLRSLFEKVRLKARNGQAPLLLLAKPDAIFDYINRFQSNLKKVVLNSRNVEKEIIERFGEGVISTEIISEPFVEYGLEEAISDALNKIVKLKSGGRICIEETRACVAIDVDSGDDNGNGSISRLNNEAAVEIARQIRLRNLSGKIIIDFAGASDFHYLKNVIETLEKEVAADYTKTTVLGLSRAGNVEIIRIRKRPSLQDLLTVECESCQGTGRVSR